MRARLADVARAAGVHPATASRALNAKTRSRLSSATVARVIAAAEELQYVPDSSARSLVTNRSASVGVVIPDLSVPLFPPLIRGVDDVFSEAGYTALIVNTDNDAQRERARLTALAARRIDGLLVTTAVLPEGTAGEVGSGPVVETFDEVAPTVYMLRSPADPRLASVLSDDTQGIHEAVRHLVRLGHRRIAHLAGPQTISTGVTRLRAYREALFEAGVEVDPTLIEVVDSPTTSAGQDACARLLNAAPEVTAILAFNDSVAFGVYRELRARGITCPAQVSVLGYSDIAGADLITPALTTVTVDHYTMGRQAARLLLTAIEHPEDYTPGSIRLPVRLTLRESTGPVPTP